MIIHANVVYMSWSVECSGHIRTVCYVWQHHLSVKSIRSRLPVPLPCCLAIKWTIDTLEVGPRDFRVELSLVIDTCILGCECVDG